MHTLDKAGSQEQPAIGSRVDVISFVSQPLNNDLHIDGKMSVDLNSTSTAEDTKFVVRVSTILPDGKAYNILDVQYLDSSYDYCRKY